MATVVILEHQMQNGFNLPYLLYALAEYWTAEGHRVLVHHGTSTPPPGDIAIANIDLTVIPPAYLALFDNYPKVINARTADISKRRYSTQLLQRNSDYDGPVIVKTNANFGGRIERRLRRRAARARVETDIEAVPTMTDYPVLAGLGDVPEEVWAEQGLVVEKFIPERDAHNYYMRVWIFLGDRERSFRLRAEVPVIKSQHIVGREAVDVPEEIRRWRQRLGFDYGKFDYVLHDGEPVLIDANRTPGALPGYPADPASRRGVSLLSAGLNALLAGH